MNNFPWKNYPIEADSPYQKARKRWKDLIQFMTGSGHIICDKVYHLDQKFNYYDKVDLTVWDHKPIHRFNNELQVILDRTVTDLNKLSDQIDQEINKIKNPNPNPKRGKNK